MQKSEFPIGHGECILIADDEAAVRDITQATLEMYNYRVVTAKDGAETVAQYAQHIGDIKVVVLDMMMPIMDGPSTIRVLENLNPEVKIVAAGGLVENGRQSNIAYKSVCAVLAKPYTAENLLKVLSEVLAKTK